GPDQSGKPGKPGKPPVVATNEPPPAGTPPAPQAPENKPSQEGGQLAQAPDAGEGCRIKGNIKGGERIYVMPGERGYDGVKIEKKKGERMFCSEAEAQAAGWRHAR